MVVPAPREVDALMKQVPRGRLATINELRAALARKHGADFTCPITTGIFSWIAAHVAAEAEAEGRKRVKPFWRTLKSGGEVNPKYPGGVDAVANGSGPKGIGSSKKASAPWWPATNKGCSPGSWRKVEEARRKVFSQVFYLQRVLKTRFNYPAPARSKALRPRGNKTSQLLTANLR